MNDMNAPLYKFNLLHEFDNKTLRYCTPLKVHMHVHILTYTSTYYFTDVLRTHDST